MNSTILNLEEHQTERDKKGSPRCLATDSQGKSEAYMLYCETRYEQHYCEYKRASNRVKIKVRKAVLDFERQSGKLRPIPKLSTSTPGQR